MALMKERSTVSWSIADDIIILKIKKCNTKKKNMYTKYLSSLKVQENWLIRSDL